MSNYNIIINGGGTLGSEKLQISSGLPVSWLRIKTQTCQKHMLWHSVYVVIMHTEIHKITVHTPIKVSPNYKVDNAQVKHFLIWIVICQLFLFLLNLSHHFFCFFILRGHDVGNTQVCKNNGTHIQNLEHNSHCW